MGAVSPVAQANAQLFGDMATTFAAISRDPNALESDDRASRRRRSTSRPNACAAQQPFLVDLDDARPQAHAGDRRARGGAAGHQPGDRGGHHGRLQRTPSLNAKLQHVMDALKDLAQRPGHEHRAERADVDRRDAQPDAPLPRAVPDRVQQLELLVDDTSPSTSPRRRASGSRSARCSTSQPAQTEQRRHRRRLRPGQRRQSPTARSAATSSSTAPRTAPRSTTRATPTARSASAATRRSSTTSTRRAATSRPTRTRPATRDRRTTAARACPRARRSAATPRSARSFPTTRNNP